MAQRIVDHTISIEELDEANKKNLKKATKKAKNNEVKAKPQSDKTDSETDTTLNPDIKTKPQSSQSEAGTETDKTPSTTSTSKKPKQKKKRSKKYQKAVKSLDKSKSYSLKEAVKLIRQSAYAGFNESVEMHINLGTDSQNSDHRIRFSVSLPHGVGKTMTILVISDSNKGKSDNVLYRDISAIDEIGAGKLTPGKDFNLVITSPKFMKDLAKVAKVLGPKGMMPSPKNNTITEEFDKTLALFSKGQVEIKSQPGHTVIHQIIGNLNFSDEQLTDNAEFLLQELNKNNPPKLKKKLIQKVFVCTSMGPSLRLDF